MGLTATTSRNPFVSDTYDGMLAGVATDAAKASSSNIFQGDIICWDTSLNSSNGGARSVTDQADMAYYLGVSNEQTPIASLGDWLTNIDYYKQGKLRFKTTVGDVYKMFAAVYLNETVDVQTVTVSTDSGNRTVAVGYVIIPQDLVMAGTLSITGAAGVDIHVVITPHYPVARAS